jgi:hypothetical protein
MVRFSGDAAAAAAAAGFLVRFAGGGGGAAAVDLRFGGMVSGFVSPVGRCGGDG